MQWTEKKITCFIGIFLLLLVYITFQWKNNSPKVTLTTIWSSRTMPKYNTHISSKENMLKSLFKRTIFHRKNRVEWDKCVVFLYVRVCALLELCFFFLTPTQWNGEKGTESCVDLNEKKKWSRHISMVPHENICAIQTHIEYRSYENSMPYHNRISHCMLKAAYAEPNAILLLFRWSSVPISSIAIVLSVGVYPCICLHCRHRRIHTYTYTFVRGYLFRNRFCCTKHTLELNVQLTCPV